MESKTVACIVYLALAALAATRARREPTASSFSALCVVLFAYSAFDALWHATEQPAWNSLSNAAAAMISPVFFHFVMTFLGQRRLRRASIAGFYAYFGLVALYALVPLVAPDASQTRTWAWLMLAGLFTAVLVGTARLVRHARRQPAEERARTALIAASVLVAAGGTATDLASIAGTGTAKFATGALVATGILLGAAAIKVRMLDRLSALVVLNALAVAIAIVEGELALLHWFGARSALLAIGSVIIALSALLAGRFLLGAMVEARGRVREQAARGRMSQQLGHDLRNPLLAIKGAAELLDGERQAGRLPSEAGTYIEIVLRHAARMARTIERYERLARLEPELRDADMNDLVEAAIASVPGAHVVKSLDRTLPTCRVDADLVVEALENVLRNAREADSRGKIAVATRNGGEVVTVEVSDDGPGMDARVLENVFDDFFTTKPEGSGLGLPFVHRVATAHRGSVKITSVLGRGTSVRIELPISRQDG